MEEAMKNTPIVTNVNPLAITPFPKVVVTLDIMSAATSPTIGEKKALTSILFSNSFCIVTSITVSLLAALLHQSEEALDIFEEEVPWSFAQSNLKEIGRASCR